MCVCVCGVSAEDNYTRGDNGMVMIRGKLAGKIIRFNYVTYSKASDNR